MKVWMAKHLFLNFSQSAKEYFPLETGGVLLGWRNGVDRVIVGSLGPGLKALHGRHLFVPDHSWQTEQIKKIFKSSNGDVDYLGDWHSHPDGILQMSSQDGRTLQKISKKVPDPLMVIVSGSLNQPSEIGCWAGRQHRTVLFRRFKAKPVEILFFDPPSHWPNYFSSGKA